ncbi:hypothetical protein Tco_0639364, partial [Tanacetum coccineum]
ARNSFVYDPHPNSFNDPPNFFNHPPQPQTYSYELCGNDSHYGFDCPPRRSGANPLDYEAREEVSLIKRGIADLRLDSPNKESDDVNKVLVLRSEPWGNYVTFSNPLFDANDDFTSSDDNSLPKEDVPEENFKIYSNPLFEFDEEYVSSDVNPLFNEVLEVIKSKDSYVSNLDEPILLVTHLCDVNKDECFDPEGDIDEIDADFESIQEDLNQQRLNDECIKSYNEMIDSRNELLKSLGEMLRDQVANLSTHTPDPSRLFNFIYDDDDESTIPLNEIISQIPPSIAITPVLQIMKPEDSLIIGDADLRTIPKKESDDVIKSSVEDLVPIPSESEDTSGNDSECDLPFYDDSFPLDIFRGNYVTFSNPLFDANDDFTSSDDNSLPKEDVPEENFKIYSNPLFEFDEEYVSSDVNPLFNEVLEVIKSKDSYVSNLDEPILLVTHLCDVNKDECFDPEGDIDEIDVDFEDDYYDSEGDTICENRRGGGGSSYLNLEATPPL